jgi:uncharacterized membrane protein
MPTARGLDRLVTFADAVVAIAITLLILPLVEIPGESKGDSVARMLSDHIGQLGAFALSFAVIARFWASHHRTFEEAAAYVAGLIQFTLVWLFTIVFLPFPTELIGSDVARGATPLYIGTLLASSLALVGTSAWLRAHPQLCVPDVPDVAAVRPRWTSPALLAISFVISLVNPVLGLWSLLLLLLTGPADRLVGRLDRARA